MSEHIQAESALALVALDPDDPERVRALTHAEECETCRALLRQGDAMLAMLDAESPRPVAPQLKARVREAVQIAAEHRRVRWERALLALLALCSLAVTVRDGSFAVPLVVGKCALFELGAAGFAFAATAMVARGTRRLSGLSLPVAAGAGAFLAQLWLRGHCETHAAGTHLLIFHTGAVGLAVALAYAARAWSRTA